MSTVAEMVILGETQHRIDDPAPVDCHPIGHAVGQAQQRHGGGSHLLALPAPFRGDRGSQLFRRQDKCIAGGRFHRPSIQQHCEAAVRRTHRNRFIKALHLFFFLAGKGSLLSSGLKPSSFQLLSMCGGRGAVACSRPPSGRPISIERAWRCSLSAISPMARASVTPYLKAPTMGGPRLAMRTRIWWARPLMGRAAAQANSCPAVPITAYSVSANLASSSSLTVMRSSRPLGP